MDTTEKTKASPAARKLARELGLSLEDIRPGDSNKVITMADVIGAKTAGPNRSRPRPNVFQEDENLGSILLNKEAKPLFDEDYVEDENAFHNLLDQVEQQSRDSEDIDPFLVFENPAPAADSPAASAASTASLPYREEEEDEDDLPFFGQFASQPDPFEPTAPSTSLPFMSPATPFSTPPPRDEDGFLSNLYNTQDELTLEPDPPARLGRDPETGGLAAAGTQAGRPQSQPLPFGGPSDNYATQGDSDEVEFDFDQDFYDQLTRPATGPVGYRNTGSLAQPVQPEPAQPPSGRLDRPVPFTSIFDNPEQQQTPRPASGRLEASPETTRPTQSPLSGGLGTGNIGTGSLASGQLPNQDRQQDRQGQRDQQYQQYQQEQQDQYDRYARQAPSQAPSSPGTTNPFQELTPAPDDDFDLEEAMSDRVFRDEDFREDGDDGQADPLQGQIRYETGVTLTDLEQTADANILSLLSTLSDAKPAEKNAFPTYRPSQAASRQREEPAPPPAFTPNPTSFEPVESSPHKTRLDSYDTDFGPDPDDDFETGFGNGFESGDVEGFQSAGPVPYPPVPNPIPVDLSSQAQRVTPPQGEGESRTSQPNAFSDDPFRQRAGGQPFSQDEYFGTFEAIEAIEEAEAAQAPLTYDEPPTTSNLPRINMPLTPQTMSVNRSSVPATRANNRERRSSMSNQDYDTFNADLEELQPIRTITSSIRVADISVINLITQLGLNNAKGVVKTILKAIAQALDFVRVDYFDEMLVVDASENFTAFSVRNVRDMSVESMDYIRAPKNAVNEAEISLWDLSLSGLESFTYSAVNGMNMYLYHSSGVIRLDMVNREEIMDAISSIKFMSKLKSILENPIKYI